MMGGNALSVQAARLSAADYRLVEFDVVQRLRAALPDSRVAAIEAYREKPSFGDLDVLISTTTTSSFNYDPFATAKAIDAVEVVRNGPVTSVGIVLDPQRGAVDGNVFQVDFISISENSFDYAFQYFRMNDAGNLLGRIAHKMGLSHRHDGLFMILKDGDQKFGEIELTKDYSKALAFMGYAPKTFLAGFDTLDQMFQYIASTEFFNSDIYLLENRDNASRIRDRKRPTYTAFLKWCESIPEKDAFEFPKDKSAWHERIQTHFGHFSSSYQQATDRLATSRAIKARFNGDFVSGVSGLQGQALGGLIREIRGSFGCPDEFQSFVLAASQSELIERVKNVQKTVALNDVNHPVSSSRIVKNKI